MDLTSPQIIMRDREIARLREELAADREKATQLEETLHAAEIGYSTTLADVSDQLAAAQATIAEMREAIRAWERAEAGQELQEAAVLEARPTDQRLLNLLCRIHRDGGHYITEHGLDKAVEDADIRVAEQNAALDAQAKQEPKWWYAQINNEWDSFTREKPPEDAYDEGTLYPLYAAPVVQPDMIRPDQEALQQIIAAALYDFGGFITTRQRQLVASATDNAADTVEALKEFMEKRGINPCQDVPVLSWQCWIAASM